MLQSRCIKPVDCSSVRFFYFILSLNYSLLHTTFLPPFSCVAGGRPSLCTFIACCGSCCQNQHGSTGRNTETGSPGQPGPGSLYTGDNVLLERGLFAGGECSVLWFPIHLYWDLFMHSQAGMHCEGGILITTPPKNPLPPHPSLLGVLRAGHTMDGAFHGR